MLPPTLLHPPATAAHRTLRTIGAVVAHRDPEGGWLCTFDLAGVHAGDYELRAQHRRLSVRGLRRPRPPAAPGSAHDLPARNHRFEISVSLPCALADCTLTCRRTDALLLVAVLPLSRNHS